MNENDLLQNNGSCRFRTPNFFCYGGTDRGESHKETDTPCQDASLERLVKDPKGKEWLVLAVADGVGSCALSHFGSSIAVTKAVEHCAAFLKRTKDPTGPALLDALKHAFQKAWEAIEAYAEAQEQLSFSFYTTLTVALYDGKKLHLGHVGDDGAVAVHSDDTISLVTTRHKGETASSVVPLQAGENAWEFRTEERVDGLILATDGMLDSFVKPHVYDDLIYEPFVTRLLYRAPESKEDMETIFRENMGFFDSPEFRERVRDDLTLLAAGSCKAMAGRKAPDFDKDAYNEKIRLVDERIERTLHPPKAETPKSQPEKPAGLLTKLRGLTGRKKK